VPAKEPKRAMKLKELKEQGRWLLRHASNLTSEWGEDGIIAKALELLPNRNCWCIEFGAWDGKVGSNTYNLIVNHGYRAVLIEASTKRFQELCKMHDPTKHKLVNAIVGSNESDSLDAILRGSDIPVDVDLLSIDIDGEDYHAWEAIRIFRPKLVVIEFNPTMANSVRFIQEKGAGKRRTGVAASTSAAALIDLADLKGYELIAVTTLNLIFVDACYYPLFHIPDNSLEVMRDDSLVTHIFECGDGTVCLYNRDGKLGRMWSAWHPGLFLPQHQVQMLPQWLRKYPDHYNRTERFLYRWWVRLRCRGLV
jgi:hypothetical protein